MRCRCDGRYPGCEHGDRCDHAGGGHRSPYFCAVCDRRRIATITRQLAEISETFDRSTREV